MDASHVEIGGQAFRLDRGEVSVPECREEPSGPSIRIAWARLHGPPGGKPPLLYLAEGPGVPVLHDLDHPSRLERWLPFLAERDLILFDQRGCGISGRDLRRRSDRLPPPEFLANPQVALDWWIEMSREARSELEASGTLLHGYHARESACDVIDLLQSLRVERIALAGFSYGAQLAVEFLRRHATSVERAFLAGVEGPGDAFKLPLQSDAYFRRVEAAAATQGTGLVAALSGAMTRLERRPVRVPLEHRRTGERFEFLVGSFGLAWLLCRELHAVGTLDRLPRLLRGISEGTPEVLEDWTRRHAGAALRIDAMPLLVDGASGASRERLRRIAGEARESAFGNAMNSPFPEINETWEPPDLGDEYRQVPRCEVPTLFVSGEWDWNAPTEQVAAVAARFPRSRHVEVRNAVHEQLMSSPAVLEEAARFLGGGETGSFELSVESPRLFCEDHADA